MMIEDNKSLDKIRLLYERLDWKTPPEEIVSRGKDLKNKIEKILTETPELDTIFSELIDFTKTSTYQAANSKYKFIDTMNRAKSDSENNISDNNRQLAELYIQYVNFFKYMTYRKLLQEFIQTQPEVGNGIEVTDTQRDTFVIQAKEQSIEEKVFYLYPPNYKNKKVGSPYVNKNILRQLLKYSNSKIPFTNSLPVNISRNLKAVCAQMRDPHTEYEWFYSMYYKEIHPPMNL